MANILLYCWNDLNDTILQENLKALGHEVVLFAHKFTNYDMDGEFSMAMLMEIHKNHCTLCFSFNYIPLISAICEAAGISYISWVFDSPNLTLYSKTVPYKCNYIFTFDKITYQALKKRGISHCCHMPLSADTKLFDEAVKKNFPQTHEVSFVGSLYTNQYNYFDKITDWEEKVYKECMDLISGQKFCYTKEKIKSRMSQETVAALVEAADLRLGDKYEDDPLSMAVMVLHKKVTVEERKELLKAVSERFSAVIYTDSDTEELPKLQNEGRADYLTQMPLIFANSRINLNITLRSIESGIPLRALDILASGGFLLSNYQPELSEYFEEGKELVLFYDKQDCLDKISYYLSHEEERKAIAQAGYKKVRECFSYAPRLRQMIEIAEGQP